MIVFWQKNVFQGTHFFLLKTFVTKFSIALFLLFITQVFVGESLSARVSHLQMRLNGSTEATNLKCSGICISTGTGSTSWHLSINRLPVQSVAELLRLLDIDATEEKNSLATVLSDVYNKNLIFSPGKLSVVFFSTVMWITEVMNLLKYSFKEYIHHWDWPVIACNCVIGINH